MHVYPLSTKMTSSVGSHKVRESARVLGYTAYKMPGKK